MADGNKPATKKKCPLLDIAIGGYLLNLEQIAQLCIHGYGIPEHGVRHAGPLDCADYHWHHREAVDPPLLIPVHYTDLDTGKSSQGWILLCRVIFFVRGTPRPKLPCTDPATRAYIDAWFPPKVRELNAFKGIRYIQTHWPRRQVVEGVVLTMIRVHRDPAFRCKYEKARQAWIDYHKQRDPNYVAVRIRVYPLIDPAHMSLHLASPVSSRVAR
ncbi:hypothetical protein K474DRAFT_1665526 [Panus rudis PR-1116 ss-1]|nr:hypothetical protein K474DRAFT_1665526 [Panus rudis PR-1116 ss-1]